jgi:cytochrome-b5 reductase
MANVPEGDEPEEIRPYTPISDNSMLGKFELLIKRYPAWGDPTFANNYKPPGKMSNYIHDLKIGSPPIPCLKRAFAVPIAYLTCTLSFDGKGASVRFKHIPVNVKKQYPFTGVRTISMLAVGVGIAPMLQALHAVLTGPEDTTQIVFLYGNRTVEDILMREKLDSWAVEFRSRFKMVYVVGTVRRT